MESIDSSKCEDQKLVGKWEFLVGKIESGETSKECLIPEIKEELGVYIKVDTFFAKKIY